MFHVAPPSAAVGAIPADPSAADAPPSARAMVEAQIAALTRLTGMAMEIAEAATRRAVAALESEAPVGDRPDPALTYTRAARAVRMTIALQSQLLKDLAALDHAEDRARTDAANARRVRIHRLVERAIEAGREDEEDEIERLSEEVRERLRDQDDYGCLLDRPLGEAVALICKDLGLPPDWGVHIWAQSAAGCEEGSPFEAPADIDGGGAGSPDPGPLRSATAAPGLSPHPSG